MGYSTRSGIFEHQGGTIQANSTFPLQSAGTNQAMCRCIIHSYRLGTVLMQKSQSTWKPIVYTFCLMVETELWMPRLKRKHLVPLLGTNHLESLPPQILRSYLKLVRVDYSIMHVLGKHLYTVDTLSRASSSTMENDTRLQEEADTLIEMYITNLSASIERLRKKYRKSQAKIPFAQLSSLTVKVDGQRRTG